MSATDAATLLFQALEKTAVRETDGSLHIGRQALRKAIYGVQNFEGIGGVLSCNEFGDCAFPVFNVLRLDDPSAGVTGLLKNVQFVYTEKGTH